MTTSFPYGRLVPVSERTLRLTMLHLMKGVMIGHNMASLADIWHAIVGLTWKDLAIPLALVASGLKIWEVIYPRARARRDLRKLKLRLGAEIYDSEEINRATMFYVEPDSQSLDPSGSEDSRRLVCAREPLFATTDRILKNTAELKFIIVLADSGMGKTSFLLNYYAYHCRSRRRNALNVALVNLSLPNADALIALTPLEKRATTALFMDAFDEDRRAIANHRQRLDELLDLTAGFRAVFITCRSQFFTKDEEIPRETGVFKIVPIRANESRVFYFHKLYLSPFSEAQIKLYLRRRFSPLKFRQRQTAKRIVDKIPDLLARPMLLAHIEDLVRTKAQLDYSFQVYEEMVNAWLEREKGLVQDATALRRFSDVLALDLFVHRQARQMERIPEEELLPLAKQYGIPLQDWQLRGRSLLNRDAAGNYKFAHRSIMEYLVICEFIKGQMPSNTEPWTDQMKIFVVEIVRSGRDRQDGHLCLAHADLSNVDFRDVDVRGLSFNEANLNGARLSGRDLSKSQLTNAQLVHADLTGSLLESATLCKANLKSAILTDADFRRATLDEAELEAQDLGGVNLSDASLRRARLTGADLTRTALSGATFQGAYLDEANLSGNAVGDVDLSDACLRHAKMNSADLRGAKLIGADLFGTQLQEANLSGQSLAELNMSGACLRRANLSDANLTRINLAGADLRGALLRRATLCDLDLSGLDLSGADLDGASLRDVNLWNTCLVRANLGRAIMNHVHFEGADLHEAVLACAHLNGARFIGANLRAVTMAGAELNQANLSGQDLSRLDLSGASLIEADLCDSILTGADLRGADLRGAKLNRAKLTSAILQGADLRGADLSGAEVSGQDFSNLDLSGADFGGAMLRGSCFRGLDLKGVNFECADLTGASFEGANLKRAKMSRVILGAASLAEADLTEVNLTKANLTDAVLRGAIMTDARMRYANLSGADLSAAEVAGANLLEAVGLTVEQVSRTTGFESAKLPPGIERGLGQARRRSSLGRPPSQSPDFYAPRGVVSNKAAFVDRLRPRKKGQKLPRQGRGL